MTSREILLDCLKHGFAARDLIAAAVLGGVIVGLCAIDADTANAILMEWKR